MSKTPRNSKKGRRTSRHSGSYLVGKNAATEALKAELGHLKTLLLVEQPSGRGDIDPLIQMAERIGLDQEWVESSDALSNLVGTDSHQGVALELRERLQVQLDQFLRDSKTKPRSLVVALDGVLDPHNVGAIFRAAECFGVDLVIWSSNRSSGITPVVTKVSSGASELVPFAAVGNLAQTLARFQKEGFWVVAADGNVEAHTVYGYEFPNRCVLVLGAEGAGVSQLVLRKSDIQVRIPMCGQIGSLNVSQAASVLLYEAIRGAERSP